MLAAASACKEPAQAPAHPASPAAPPGEATRGVKVPLADGWSARLGKEQSLSFGPAGRTVLRIDLRPGAASSKPDAAALLRLFSASFDAGVVAEVSRKDEAAISWVTLRLGGKGAGTGEPALLGAKVLGEDLFLCATLPGASFAEVEAAARACEGITHSAGP